MHAERARKAHANSTPIADIMTRDVICVSPETSVETLAELMIERGFSGAPVVDASNRVLGVVSKTDLVRRSIDGDTQIVEHIMTPTAFTLSESATIAEAAALMAFENAHRIPIVSKSDVVVGIVSALDVLRWIAADDGYLVGRPARR